MRKVALFGIGFLDKFVGMIQPLLLHPKFSLIFVKFVNPLERILYFLLNPIQKMVQGKTVINITAEKLRDRMKSSNELQLIDNRSVAEYKLYHIHGTINVPIGEVASYMGKMDKKKPVVFICLSGIRGYFAGMLALTYGHDEVCNLIDGLVGGWIKAGLPTD